MGDISEMMLDGTLCQVCGSLMEDLIVPGSKELKEAPGYPRTCTDCQNEKIIKRNYNMIRKRRGKRK